MGLTYSDMQRTKNTSGWTITGGMHVTCLFPTLGGVSGQQQPPVPLYMFEGDNNANTKWCSRPTPADGVNPNISTYWECWIKMVDPVFDNIFFIIANQQNLDVTSATIRGYSFYFNPSGGVVGLYRIDGAGVLVDIGSIALAQDTNLHRCGLSREVSGANRFFRLYLDNMTTSIVGPINSLTYTNFSWWGWNMFARPRIVFGAEACRS
ncbi:MAG: hypothetical protein H7831_16180 [Magnetococcus sp. WYHC-3]